MDFINKTGEYDFTMFTMVQTEKEIKEKKPNKTFTIVGSEVDENSIKMLDMVDTFKSSDGIFSTRKRSEILDAFKKGKIKPVADSIIKINPVDKKQWDKLKGRG